MLSILLAHPCAKLVFILTIRLTIKSVGQPQQTFAMNIVQPIKTGLVGFGISGACFQMPVIKAVRDLDLCYVVSGNPDKVKTALPSAKVFTSLEEMLAKSDVELVVIATPNAEHYPMAKLALEADKHVVVEKPFVIDSKEGEELIALAHSRHLKLTVYHSRRFDGDFQTVQHLVREGTLGNVHTFYSSYNRYRPVVKDRWRERDEAGAGILYDLGSHLIDQALRLFGMPTSLAARLRCQRQGAQTVDHFHLVLNYPNTDVILHGNCLSTAQGPRFQVFGDKGSFIKSGMDPQEDFLREGKDPGTKGWAEDSPEHYGQLVVQAGSTPIQEIVPTLAGGYEDFYQQTAGAIRGRNSLPVSADQALAIIRIIEAAYQSDRQRKCISL